MTRTSMFPWTKKDAEPETPDRFALAARLKALEAEEIKALAPLLVAAEKAQERFKQAQAAYNDAADEARRAQAEGSGARQRFSRERDRIRRELERTASPAIADFIQWRQGVMEKHGAVPTLRNSYAEVERLKLEADTGIVEARLAEMVEAIQAETGYDS
jgi:hypothetical protein